MSETKQDRPSYKNTLNLPRTGFAMKANLVQNEPASLKRWQEMGLYQRLRELGKSRKRFVFHDGPPYANGPIHLGHMLNKVLKDIVVRSRGMLGYDVPYVPGWDCHGLPIEHKVIQELGEQAKSMPAIQIRRKCKASVEKYIKLQSTQMQRLLTLGDYNNPYITMLPEYEAAELEVLANLVERGIVYRGLKPVHWSIANRTALADAELEYYDREDTSVYVLFEVANAPAGAAFTHLMIWTTTPWTLPANLAVAVNERYDYGVYDIGNGRRVVIAVELAPRVLAAGGHTGSAEPVSVLRGADLLCVTYKHPFIDRTGRVVGAEYVTLEDGTGLVHTAPGHGAEDYQTGLREGLEIYCPVKDDGTFDDTVPEWLRGVDVWTANGKVVEHLRASGHLFHDHKFLHSYPHDWRGKSPVIFRATEQWFISVDKPFEANCTTASLRQRAIDAVEKDVTFYPGWGRNRLRGMLETRPDWCISRQRSWGVPIPAFYPPEGVEGEVLLTPASVRAVAKLIGEKGTDVWFLSEARDLLQYYDPNADPDAPQWVREALADPNAAIRKGSDTLDVWVDSGSSWNAVVRRRFGDEAVPTDLYIEGSDQHRGWFQSSLLLAIGATARPPFKAILTHGFMVDRDGKKMSKSLGNALEVEDLLKDFGADVCRWWVSSLNTDNDIKVDLDYFKVAGEEYRKVRNTLRYLLSNLFDFDPKAHRYTFTETDASSIDAWALDELNRLTATVRSAYEQFAFRKAHEALFSFCNETLSATYLAATKDRLYCDAADSPRRRRTQTAMYDIAHALCRLVAPILPHTADEAFRTLIPDGEVCVHLELLPEQMPIRVNGDWQKVMAQREVWLKAIEDARQSMDIDNPLDCGLVIARTPELEAFDRVDLADLCGISRVEFADDADQPRVIDLRHEPRCERSWKRDGTVKQRSDGGMLTDRDAAALGLA